MKKKLDNITLIAGNWVNPESAVKALKYSMRDISFNKVIIFTDREPNNLIPEINFIQTEKLNHMSSSKFGLHELPKYIETDFCLSIHDDGFIINPHLWTDEFLQYDYVGAPWRFGHEFRVGNGGFCLRSKKFLDLCKTVPYQPGIHDDWHTCVTHRDIFLKEGCKYAPVEIAMLFSLESKIPECEYNLNNCFGFHGKGIVHEVHQGEGQQFQEKINLLNLID
jgi:hypothetical protein